jgi:Icc-related predicted phosphoesterase
LKNLQRTGHLDAVFVVGDLTDNGNAEQYDQLLSIFKDTSVIPATLPVYFMMGNHEYYTKKDENSVENYKTKIHQPMHQFIDIKGYPYITISCEGHGNNDYKEEAQKFLETHLAKADQEYAGKPIFVFFHFPPRNTSYGSHSWGSDVVVPYLEKYPQVVVFNGHVHTPVGDPRVIFQDKYTAINDGSVTYVAVVEGEVDRGPHPERNQEVADGLIVNVLPGSLLNVERWDTYRNVSYKPWHVDWKNKNYKGQTNSEAPKFEFGAKPNVQVTGTGCSVTYSQAKDDDILPPL